MSDNVFTLSRPIEVGGKTYPSLVMRELRVKDLIQMDLVKGGVNRTVAMYASMCGVPITVFYEMRGDDYAKFLEVIQSFLGVLGEAIIQQALAVAASD